ncbi:hypothetical protein GCM10027591_05230 [Zhihengliuella somnathii]
MTKRRSLLGYTLISVLVMALCVAAGWWAASATFGSAASADSDDQPAEELWAVASEGSIGRTLDLNVTVEQPTEPVAVNMLSGVVTNVGTSPINSGDVLYTVGDQSVHAIESATPQWRDLRRGLSGDDVRGLQEFLRSAGHLASAADGTFGPGTEAAVKAWQRSVGKARTGRIPLGELISVPTLPIDITYGEDLQRGRLLNGGEPAINAPDGSLNFTLPLTEDQVGLVPLDTTVRVHWDSVKWDAVISAEDDSEPGLTRYVLRAPGGGPVCGEDCSELPAVETATLRADIHLTEPASGPSVPLRSVRFGDDGSAYVITRGGRTEVKVTGSGEGIAVVEGIETGTDVLLSDPETTTSDHG